MLFLFLLSVSFSVQRFCLCQPDRDRGVCSLQEKCRRYSSQSDIIVYNSQTKFGKNLFPNLNLTHKVVKNVQNNRFDNILFEVFGSKAGSKKNSPITINMLDDMFSDIKKIAIYGGEFNQVVHIQNINSSQISLEAQNIQIVFENSHQISFDKLSLRNSFLKFENTSTSKLDQTKLLIKAKEVIGDSNSLSSDYFKLIKTEKIKVTDQKEFNDLSNNFGITAPIEIIDVLSQNFSQEDKKKIVLLDDQDDISYEYFCIATSSRLSRSKDLAECEKYSVPLSNYYSGKEQEFISQIQNAKNNSVFRLYITLSTESDPIRMNIQSPQNASISLMFISADVDSETRIEIKGTPLNGANSTLGLSKIDYALFDATYLQTFTNIQLSQSPIHLNDAGPNTTLLHLQTDCASISQFTESIIHIKETLTLSKTSPVTLQGKIYLDKDCMVEVNQYSNFPITRYNYDFNDNIYYLTLSDGLEDQRLNLYFNETIKLNFTESATYPNAPTLTFAGGKTLFYTLAEDEKIKKIRQECPYINFSIYTIGTGINVNYGTGSEREMPFPHSSAFTFYNNIIGNVLNLTINDFQISKFNISEMFLLVFYTDFTINCMTPLTISAYLQGVNNRFKDRNCTDVYHSGSQYPIFVEDGRCFTIGAYNLTLLNLDVQDALTDIKYNMSTVYVNLSTSDQAEKFPAVFKEIELTTNTSDAISFSISPGTLPDNITALRLILEGEPTLNFGSAFDGDFSESMNKLKINHGKNNLLLVGDQVPVPGVILDDPVSGVLFESNANSSLSEIDDSTFKENTRYGPNIEVSVTKDTTFPQPAFLAQNVKFNGPATLTFEYYNESRVFYEFNNIPIKFKNVNGGAVNFKGKSISLRGSTTIQQSSGIPLTIEVDILLIDSVSSIPASKFSGPIKVNNRTTIDIGRASSARLLESTDVQQIIFGDNTVSFVDKDGTKTVPIQQTDTSSQININIDQSDPIQLSVEDGAEAVPSNLNMNFQGRSADVDFDKSWNDVTIPPSFSTNFNGVNDVKVSTEMMNLPDIKGLNNSKIQTTTHKQKLTKELAFYIFIGIAAFVFLVGIILCIVGLTCCRYVEELDISSSAEGHSDIGIGELDGLPYTPEEERIRDFDTKKIKEAKLKQIEERKRKEEKRRMKQNSEELNPSSQKEEASFEDGYPDEGQYPRGSTILAPPPKQKKKKPVNKDLSSETSEEFNAAKKKAQLNAASGVADTPAPPPTKKLKPAESDNDLPQNAEKAEKKKKEEEEIEEASYNDSDVFSEFSD